MADFVLDASAILAFIMREPGAEKVEPLLSVSLLLSVNLAEAATKLIDRGADGRSATNRVGGLGCEVVVFDAPLAARAATLHSVTRSRGLSLGDRACLALAERDGLPALTSDRAWADLDIGVEVRLIR